MKPIFTFHHISINFEHYYISSIFKNSFDRLYSLLSLRSIKYGLNFYDSHKANINCVMKEKLIAFLLF